MEPDEDKKPLISALIDDFAGASIDSSSDTPIPAGRVNYSH